MNPYPQGLSRAEWTDAPALSRVIAQAFHNLAPSQWLISDPGARAAILPVYFGLLFNEAMTHGVVYTNTDRTAAALWIPRGRDESEHWAEYERRLPLVTGVWVDRFHIFDELLAKNHPTGIRHDHLAILAVAPDWQRQHIGTTLLDAHHQRLDRGDINRPAYLEASGPDTRQLYLQHGYVDHAGPIHLPDGPALYPMWRNPSAESRVNAARVRTPTS